MERFNLSDLQVRAIVDMKLSQLTRLQQDKLHAEDQPLEPFFFSKGFIVVPELDKIDFDNFHIEKYTSDSGLYKIQTAENNNEPYFCLPIKVDEQTSGYIRRQPQLLKDLADVIFVNSIDISTFLSEKFNTANHALLSNQTRLDKKIAICCIIPVKRHVTDVTSEHN